MASMYSASSADQLPAQPTSTFSTPEPSALLKGVSIEEILTEDADALLKRWGLGAFASPLAQSRRSLATTLTNAADGTITGVATGASSTAAAAAAAVADAKAAVASAAQALTPVKQSTRVRQQSTTAVTTTSTTVTTAAAVASGRLRQSDLYSSSNNNNNHHGSSSSTATHDDLPAAVGLDSLSATSIASDEARSDATAMLALRNQLNEKELQVRVPCSKANRPRHIAVSTGH